MGELVPLLWATQTAKDRSGVATCEHLKNCYLQPNPPGSKTPFKILGSPGLKFQATFGAGPIRGVWFVAQFDRLFVVSGNELYVVASDMSSAMIGAIPGSGPVSMCNNATHVWIATNLGLYVATLVAVANVDANYYTSVTYQDGYGIATLYGSEQFYISGLDDLTTIDPLDFSSADTFADLAVGCISDHQELIIFGQETAESYYNSGDAYFPFTRARGAFLETGCASGLSITKAQNQVFWHGDDGAVWALMGNQPRKISTAGIEKWISERLLPNESRALICGREGAEFYTLSWSNGTIAYNTSTGLWHEQESWGETRWRADCAVHAWGLDLAGDFENGNLYSIDPDTYCDENGAGVVDPLVMSMQPPPLHGSGRRMLMSEILLDCEMGVGLGGGGFGSDPQWILEWSDNGGMTWGTSLSRSAGLSGDYKHQAKWARLGSFYNRSLRISIAEPVKRIVLGAYARLDVCNG